MCGQPVTKNAILTFLTLILDKKDIRTYCYSSVLALLAYVSMKLPLTVLYIIIEKTN